MRTLFFLPRLSVLSLALIFSIAVHAVLLTVRFINPRTFDRIFASIPLEVILVNAKTQQQPEQSKTIAQTNMAGGGNTAKGRASSPLPYAAITTQAIDPEEKQQSQAQKQQKTMREQQNHMLTQLRQALAQLPAPKTDKALRNQHEIAQEQKRLLLLKQLAEIERLVKIENERPRKRFISPSAKESIFALYLDQVRRSIEQFGTQNFPTQNGRRLYGKLLMITLINFDGKVISTELVQGSGNPALDRRAQTIVTTAGPFDVFSATMRKQTDQIGFVSRFDFKQDATLSAEFQEFNANHDSNQP